MSEIIRSDYKTRGIKFHFEFDPFTKIMKIYGPASIHFAHEGDLMAQIRVNDWWSGFDQARNIVENVKIKRGLAK